MIGYFGQRAIGGNISGDDVNRRLRERRRGHAEPSKDWADCKVINYCLWDGQQVRTFDPDGRYHNGFLTLKFGLGVRA